MLHTGPGECQPPVYPTSLDERPAGEAVTGSFPRDRFLEPIRDSPSWGQPWEAATAPRSQRQAGSPAGTWPRRQKTGGAAKAAGSGVSGTRWAQAGTTSTMMPRAGCGGVCPVSARAGPYYRSHSASRRLLAPLGVAGSYLNRGREENGGERLSVGETGRRRRSWALAPFPGEWGLEGGSNEWREESSSSGSPACGGGVGLGWGREGSSSGLALRGGSLLSLSPPSPIWMCLPEGRRKGA